MKTWTKAALFLVYAGVIFTLVRPGSQGPLLVSTLFTGTTNKQGQSNGDGLLGLLSASMGGGQPKENRW